MFTALPTRLPGQAKSGLLDIFASLISLVVQVVNVNENPGK